MSDKKAPPLVIFGLDAGDPTLMKKWADEGYLPTMSKIMKRGFWATTSGKEMQIELGVWASMLSGYKRNKYGYHYFRQLIPGTYDLEKVDLAKMGAPPFYSKLQDREKKIAIFDVPETFPIKGLNGIQLYNWAILNPGYDASTLPAKLIENVREIYGPQIKLFETMRTNRSQDVKLWKTLIDRVKKGGELYRKLMSRDKFDLIITGFTESHLAVHKFWQYLGKNRDDSKTSNEEKLENAIRDIHQAIDKQMGLFLEQLPGKVNVAIFSSFGTWSKYPTPGLINDFLEKLGYYVPSGPAPFSLHPVSILRRVLSEKVRIRLSALLLSNERREKILADQFRQGADWSKTTAFAIPSYYMGFIRVNLKGREPNGIIEPGDEYEKVLKSLEKDLKLLVNAETGEPSVNRVFRPRDEFGIDPKDILPDLCVDWSRSKSFVREVIHPNATITQEEAEFHRGTDHDKEGFIAAAGPSIKQSGNIGEVDVLDLAPTFLALMNEPRQPDMTGSVVKSILK